MTILYSGHKDHYIRRVSILLGADAARAIIGWELDNKRILTAQFHTGHAKVTIIQVYVPTETDAKVEKKELYSLLQDTLAYTL